MALVKYGAFIVEARGSVGVETYSKNRAGPYLKSRVSPPYTTTAPQLVARSYIYNVSQYWRTLTDVQRQRWSIAATRLQPHNIFGDVRPYSGYLYFMKVNVNILSISKAILPLPVFPFILRYEPITSLSARFTSQTLNIIFISNVIIAYSYKIYATPGVSAGKSFKSVDFYQITTLINRTAQTISLTAAYIAKFGAIPAIDKKILIKVIAVQNTTGMPGIPSYISTIVIT